MMGLNFVFLRGKMYDGTSTEQKTKNAKKRLGFIIRCLSHFYNFSERDKSHPPLFTQKRQKSVTYYTLFGVVQPTLSTV